MTIVVDGDNVTINGKPVDEFDNAHIKVIKRRGVEGAEDRWDRMEGMNDKMVHLNDKLAHLNDMMPNGTGAFLGVMTDKADNDEGVKITSVTKESAAEKAGLKKDDVITKVGSKKIASPEDLVDAIGDYKPKDKVDITYKRNGKENMASATLGAKKSRVYAYRFNDDDFDFDIPTPPAPPVGGDNFNFFMDRKPKIGLQIQDVEEGKGATVKDVDDNSPASKAGLKEGDVITQLNGKDIDGVDNLRDLLKDAKPGDTVKLSYKRGSSLQNAEIKIPKRLKTANL